MTAEELIRLGFAAAPDGALSVPPGACVQLVPIREFYELQISLDDGTIIAAVMGRDAVKMAEPKP
jgi:hypothetical protein